MDRRDAIRAALEKLPPEHQLEAANEALRQFFRSSLYHTCKYLLGYSKMTTRTHGEMCKALQSPSPRKLIVMPRGTFKSSIGVVGYSIWLLLNNPNLRILIDSEVYTNSKNFIREIKAHLTSDKFRQVFGDWQGDVWTEGEIIVAARKQNKKEGSIVASGVGAIKVGQHFDVYIGDDLNSNKNSATPEGCEKVINHFRYTMSILEPEGTAVVIGTRYSQQDLIQSIIDNELEESQQAAILEA